VISPVLARYLTGADRKAKNLKLRSLRDRSDHYDLQAPAKPGSRSPRSPTPTASASPSTCDDDPLAGPQLIPPTLGGQGAGTSPTVSTSYDWRHGVGTVAAGRIGSACCGAQAFDVQLHYTDLHRLLRRSSASSGSRSMSAEEMVRTATCDDQRPLYRHRGLFNDELIHDEARRLHRPTPPREDLRPGRHRPGAGKRQLAGYAGDVWFPSPRREITWRSMPHHGMTRISRSSLSASTYAAGTREILECWFENRPIREEYLIVQGGKLAGAAASTSQARDQRI